MVHKGIHATHIKGKPYRPIPDEIKKIIKNVELTSQQQGFRVRVFQTSEASTKRVVKTIDAAIKKEWEHADTVKECAKQKLTSEEKAFVLNFLVYWKELEIQQEYRESPKQVVDYLFRESVEHLWETGKASYCVSLLSQDGSPAGMLLGALLRPYNLLTHNGVGMDPMRGGDLINFYQYIVVPKEYREKGAADVLRAEAEKFVKTHMGHNSDIIIAQVAKTNLVYDDEVKLGMLKHEIPGLRHFEMIPADDAKYATQTVFPAVRDQDQLILRVDVPDGKGVLLYSSIEDMAMALVSYYDVYPGHMIAGTKKEAFDSYVEHHLENVKQDERGNVKLEYRP